jgi:hypothetical protein
VDREILQQNLKRGEIWLRLLFLILFAVIYGIAEIVLGAVVLLQFGFVLITAERNPRLLRFGAELSRFMYQIFLFVTFNTDQKPFPFAEWPKETPP